MMKTMNVKNWINLCLASIWPSLYYLSVKTKYRKIGPQQVRARRFLGRPHVIVHSSGRPQDTKNI